MRRIFAVFALFLLLLTLIPSAQAVTGASGINSYTSVSSDGTCQVTVTVTFHLESAVDELYFPIPSNARDIAVGGERASTRRSGDILQVDLSRKYGGMVGDFTVTMSYHLPNAVAYDENNKLILTLPLLSGFAYPVEMLNFQITLPPGTEIVDPVFTSTYRNTAIQQSMVIAIDEAKINGVLNQPTNDHESLFMMLEVSPNVFPQKQVIQWTLNIEDMAMTVLAILALLYWLVFLRCLPPRRIRRATAPEGYTAGDMGSVLTMQGTDLTMMVLTWAQLGYILIHLDDNGRVILHKRMDMGNERSNYENRIFKALFGKHRSVDGTGYHYAQLCQKVAAGKPNISGLLQRGSGNPVIFRVLVALIGLFGGTSLAGALAGESFLGILLMIIFAPLGVIVSWFIQEAGTALHLRFKGKKTAAAICSGIWLALGILSGEWNVALIVILAQWAAGIAAAYGGMNRISFGSGGFEVNPVIIQKERKEQLNRNILMFFTGFSRFSSEIEKEKVKVIRDKTAELKEMAKMVDIGEGILTDRHGDLDDFGRLLHQSWQLKRGIGSGVSTNDLDCIYQKAMQSGALGGKLLGAGGGGFFIFYTPEERQEAVKDALSDLLYVPFSFEDSGTKVLYYRPEDYIVE